MKTLMAGFLFFSILYSCYLHSKLLLMLGICNSLDFSTVNLWQLFLQYLSMCFCVSSVHNVWIWTCIWNWWIWAIFDGLGLLSWPLTLSCLKLIPYFSLCCFICWAVVMSVLFIESITFHAHRSAVRASGDCNWYFSLSHVGEMSAVLCRAFVTI